MSCPPARAAAPGRREPPGWLEEDAVLQGPGDRRRASRLAGDGVAEQAAAAGTAAAAAALDPRGDLALLPPAELATWAYLDHVATGSGWHGRRQARSRRLLAAHEAVAGVLWDPLRRVAVVLDPPRELHLGPRGPHRTDGPAVVWADGTEEFYLHGVRLGRHPSAGGWTVAEIHAASNSEARRVMIEAIGWDTYVQQAELRLVAMAPDPGNAPHELSLYDLPRQHYRDGRLLLMTNGSPDRSGEQRQYAEFVPATCSDPVEAAAWQYGVPPEVHRTLARRT